MYHQCILANYVDKVLNITIYLGSYIMVSGHNYQSYDGQCGPHIFKEPLLTTTKKNPKNRIL